MTKLLEHAVKTVRHLPPEVQDELARMLLQFAGEDLPRIKLTEDELADLLEADEEISRGDFATEAEVRVLWDKPLS